MRQKAVELILKGVSESDSRFVWKSGGCDEERAMCKEIHGLVGAV